VDSETAYELVRGQRNVAGVQEVLDVNGTLAIMKSFNPDLQEIYLIYDNTESGLAAKAHLERAVGNLNPKVSVQALNNASYQDIIEKLRIAPDNHAALMATYSRDRNGVVMELERYVQLFSKDSRIPIYVLYDFEVGYGAVGGSVLSGCLEGKKAAELGVQILNGENPAIVIPRDLVSHVNFLDYQQIQRYNLPLDRIPAGSELINSPQSFYDQNKKAIWITMAVFCFMAISIIVLALNIRQRKTAEASLKRSNEELAATYEEAVASQEELQTQYEQLEMIQQALFASEERYKYLAYHDSLTGLWNRAALGEQMNSVLHQDYPHNSGAILYIDIDNFKFVNDTFGHSLGDKLLVLIAHMMNAIVGNKGFLARMGGDEFVVVLYDVCRSKAAHYATLLAEAVKAPLPIDNNKIYITFSIGVTMFPEDGADVEKLQKNADFAMYQAKEQGKNQYMFFNDSMETVLREKLLLERNLREAIANSELKLWYQPFIELATGRIIAFEALLRWYSPEYGIILPAQFISLAEKSGLIIPIGRKVLRDACYFIAALRKEGYSNLQVSVNISVIQLIAEDFIPSVQEIIAQTGASPDSLGFEITESVFMEQSNGLAEKLKWLKDMGITVLLDDFGSGYSSLKYLNNLPVDVVKIDKSFIDRLNEDGDKKQLAEVIIALAHQINAKAVAEGVETKKQLDRLIEYQCEIVQGYLFSKPVPEEAVRGLLLAEQGRIQESLCQKRQQ
jgi:diguanylate cyclase (GGDEF)-like protein